MNRQGFYIRAWKEAVLWPKSPPESSTVGAMNSMNIGQIGQDYGASVTTGSEIFMTVSVKGMVVPVLF